MTDRERLQEALAAALARHTPECVAWYTGLSSWTLDRWTQRGTPSNDDLRRLLPTSFVGTYRERFALLIEDLDSLAALAECPCCTVREEALCVR